MRALLIPIVIVLASVQGAEIRLFDNSSVNAVIDAVDKNGMKVTLMDGEAKIIPLADIITINFRGREHRMLLSCTQELRFVNGDHLRGKFVRNNGDKINFDAYAAGSLNINLDCLKGFLSVPGIGRAAREADEALESSAGKMPFLDSVFGSLGERYDGVIRSFTPEGVEIDLEEIRKCVTIPALQLAGARFADASRKATPQLPTEPIVRIRTTDGSSLDGWLEKIELARWEIKPVWDDGVRVPVLEKQIVSIQVLNGKRLYLSQLKPVRVKETTTLAPPQPFRMDKSCQGDTLTIGGHTYPWGIGVHANSELTFAANKAFKSFQTLIGIDGRSENKTGLYFSVLGDGKELYKSPIIKGGQAPIEVSVSVENVTELMLKVESAGASDFGAWADWAAAQLLR